MKSALPSVLIAILVICGGWLHYYQQSQPEPGAAVQHPLPPACTRLRAKTGQEDANDVHES